MLGNISSPVIDTVTQDAWKTTLAVSDIVFYRFSVAEEDGTAQPTALPCHVLDLENVAMCITHYSPMARRRRP